MSLPCLAYASTGRAYRMTTATRNPSASKRLWREVHDVLGGRSKSWLSDQTGISRPTLDGYLVKGVMPTEDGMARIARALGIEPTLLWLRWLDVPLPDDALVRIAEALERAYPPTPPLEELVAQGEELTARADRRSRLRGVAPKRRATDS